MTQKETDRSVSEQVNSLLTQKQRNLVSILSNVELSTAMEVAPPWAQSLLRLEMKRRVSEDSLEDIYKAIKLISAALVHVMMSSMLSKDELVEYVEKLEDSIEIEFSEPETDDQTEIDEDDGVDGENQIVEEVDWNTYVSFELMRLQYNQMIFEGMIAEFDEQLDKQMAAINRHVQKLSEEVLLETSKLLGQQHLQKPYSLVAKHFLSSDLIVQ